MEAHRRPINKSLNDIRPSGPGSCSNIPVRYNIGFGAQIVHSRAIPPNKDTRFAGWTPKSMSPSPPPHEFCMQEPE